MEKQPKTKVSKETKEKWKQMIEEQRKVAKNPKSQREAEEFQKEISSLTPQDLLQEFNI